MADLIINGRSLAGMVSTLLTLEGVIGGTAPVVTVLPAANGGGVFGTGATLSPRRARVSVLVRGSSPAARETFAETLTKWLGGLLEMWTDAATDRAWYAALAAAPAVRAAAGVFAHSDFMVDLDFASADPTRYELEPQPIALSTTRVEVPVGSVPTAPRLWIYGACVDPHVIVRAPSGEPVSDLALEGTLGSNDALAIDAARESIDRYVSGVLQTGTAAGLAWYASGYFPVLSADDAGYDGATPPTVELSAASGTPTGLLLHSRGY